ncbi:MAG: DUF1822 family protein [Potamolinea sp.]
MTNSLDRTNQVVLDYEALPIETIDLSPELINQAVEISTKIPNEELQWQTYLNALAMFSFEEWLETRARDLNIHRVEQVLQPATINAIPAFCHLQINGFKVCLLATGSLTDEEVSLPRPIVDLPEFIPHLYVLVEVQEEQEVAMISGFLSYDQLVNQRDNVNLQADEDWTYQLPFHWFETDPDDLLLYLRCLEPSTITLPTIVDRKKQLSQVRSELEALLPQLQSPSSQLWEVLTWKQGEAVLTSPELLEWVYQVQKQEGETLQTVSRQNHLTDILKLLTQPAMNVGRWLGNELDELAEELSWKLLPSLAIRSSNKELATKWNELDELAKELSWKLLPSLAIRSPTEEFAAIVRELKQTGVNIPLQGCGAYLDLRLAGIPLRLYAVTWPLVSDGIPEWTLLLVLGSASDTSLPPGLKLRVSDQSNILVEEALDEQENKFYLFTSVIGSREEKFIVTVSLAPGIEQTFPPFSFNPERQL